MANWYNRFGGSSNLFNFPDNYNFPAEGYFKDAAPARGIFGSLVGVASFSMVMSELVNAVGDTPNVKSFSQLGKEIKRAARADVVDYYAFRTRISSIQADTPPWTIAFPGETNGVANISWTATVTPATFSHYETTLTDSSGNKTVLDTLINRAIFNGLDSGAYSAVIKGVAGNGSKSVGYRKNLVVPVFTATPPDPVSMLQACGTDEDEITMMWTKPANSDLKHVVISASVTKHISDPDAVVDPADQTILAASNQRAIFTVPLSSSVEFTATAYDNADETSPTVTVTGTPLDPNAPEDVDGLVASSPTPTSIELDWDNPALPLTGVRITRQDDSSTLDFVGGIETATYSGLTTGQTYSFTLQAYRIVFGAEYLSPGVGISTSTAADEVSNLQARGRSETEIRVSWLAPQSANYSHTIVRANVLFTPNDPPSQTINDGTPQRADFTVPLDSTVRFTVTAYNTNNAASDDLTVTASPDAARTPQDVLFPAINATTGTSVRLTWFDPDNQQLIDATVIDETMVIPFDGIRVRNVTDNQSYDIASGVERFDDTGLSADTDYDYIIQTYRTTVTSRIYSPGINSSVNTDNTPPAEVTGLAIALNGQIDSTADTAPIILSWTDPTDSDLDSIRINYYPTSDDIDVTTGTVDEGVESFTATNRSK